jgi:hypothetical protein
MGINAAWITEDGESKQEVFDPCQCLTRLAIERWYMFSESKCIQFIDPWGDAIFNQSQVPHLLAELRSELKQSVDPEERVHLENVVRLVELTVDQTHTYVKFTGD